MSKFSQTYTTLVRDEYPDLLPIPAAKLY